MSKDIVKKESSFVAKPMDEALAQLNEELSLDGDDGMTYIRASVAPSGVKSFVLKDEDDEEMAEELVGVVVYAHATNTRWASQDEQGDDNSPLCSSIDGVTGYDRDDVPHDCIDCPYNKWKSAGIGKGKKCKNGYRVYLLRENEDLPIVVNAPPTSKNPVKGYLNRLVKKEKIPYYSVVTRYTVSKKESNGNSYGVIVPEMVEAIDGDLSFFKDMHDEIKKASKRFTIESESDTFDYEKAFPGAEPLNADEEKVED